MDHGGRGWPGQGVPGTGRSLLPPRPGQPAAARAAGTPPRAGPSLRAPTAPLTPRLTAHSAVRQWALLAAYLAAGIAVTWPRASYLAGRLPATRDAAGYVWGFWWVAHQVIRLRDPWVTRAMAAPVGAQLGYHTLMPLPGVLLAPLTLTAGPAVSYNLLSLACPGLLAYAMYRAARLWLPGLLGPVAAGVFFGLSPILAWRSWYEVNLAAGALFLPMALEAVVRLRRSPGRRQAVILGAVMAAAVLTDQESAVLAAILVGVAMLAWLAGHPSLGTLRTAALAGAVGAVLASPQLVAMAQQALSGGAAATPRILATDYVHSGAGLEQLFAPSPRLAGYGLTSLALPYYDSGPASQVVVGYGVTLILLALLGLVVAWRRRSARQLALLWLGSTLLALGSALWIGSRRYTPLAQVWQGIHVSALLPFTWFVQLPGLADFREADRFTELALVPAALLAGTGLAWLSRHARPVMALAAVLAVLETGWSGNPALGTGTIATMPAAFPALTAPIAADHSRSIVVALPFGIRGGLPVLGGAVPPQALVLATADHHPLADAYISRIPGRTRTGIAAIPFYAGLLRAQGSPEINTPADVNAARVSAARLHIGWVVDWEWSNRAVTRFLGETGFRFGYRADGARVYRAEGARAFPAGRARAPRAAAGSPGAVRPGRRGGGRRLRG